jgi:hypothetical protein
MRYFLVWFLVNLVLLIPFTANGQVQDAEFGALSAWELTFGEAVQTDCSVELVSRETGQIYCFSSEAGKTAFEKDMKENIKRASAEYKNLAN